MTDWMSEGLKSLLFTEFALVTQNLPSSGMNRSHSTAFVFSNSSSNVSAVKSQVFKRILSGVRRNTLA